MELMNENRDYLLYMDNIKVYFPIKKGMLRRAGGYVRAVDGVNLFIRKEETLGLVGESGSGKTTLGRAIIRLVPNNEGQALFRTSDDQVVDFFKLEKEVLRNRRREIQMIFQDPYSSLNPRMRIQTLLEEPLKIYNIGTPREGLSPYRRTPRKGCHSLLAVVLT